MGQLCVLADGIEEGVEEEAHIWLWQRVGAGCVGVEWGTLGGGGGGGGEGEGRHGEVLGTGDLG